VVIPYDGFIQETSLTVLKSLVYVFLHVN